MLIQIRDVLLYQLLKHHCRRGGEGRAKEGRGGERRGGEGRGKEGRGGERRGGEGREGERCHSTSESDNGSMEFW